MNFTIAQESRIGSRPINQDRVAWVSTGDSVLMVVADGMGGHLHGEIAAQLVVDTVTARFRDEAQTRLAEPAGFLATALRQAHETIVRYATACRIAPHAAPRSTCIACVVQDRRACWAHAGDSRLYLIHGQSRGPAGVAQTRDHSLVQRLVDAGSLSRAEAASHPLRNRVFSCLGGDVMPQIEVSQAVALEDGDLIALCTDGAWAPLGEALVSELGGAPVASAVPQLLDAAERAAGARADNLTLIAMRWQGGDARAASGDLMPAESAGAAPEPASDNDIERAVADLRRRNPHKSQGAAR
jgi:serine/threonine protein phosphatase PrpC